jgi:hypothetical protein
MAKGRKPQQPIHPKVAAAGVGSLITTVLVWVVGLMHVQMPVEVVSAITGLMAIGFAWKAPRLMNELAKSEDEAETDGFVRAA